MNGYWVSLCMRCGTWAIITDLSDSEEDERLARGRTACSRLFPEQQYIRWFPEGACPVEAIERSDRDVRRIRNAARRYPKLP